MTGTATEVAPEMWSVYKLPVWRDPDQRASQARRAPAALPA
jgi:hypothetical protein